MLTPARRTAIALLAALLLASTCPGLATAAPPAQGQTVHVVQAGETLFRIAQAYGVTVDDIVAANGLADRNVIHVGQQLVIPAAGAATAPPVSPPATYSTDYIVQPGDTLTLIAQRFNTSVEAIAQANSIVNPNLVVVGQLLAVPVPQGAPPPPSQTVTHVVQPGETLARIALRYNTTAWAIAQTNDLSNPNVIFVGQRLVIPTPKDDEIALLPPFAGLLFEPATVTQGQTVAVTVSTDREVTLSGTFGGRLVRFIGEGGSYWALVGVHAMVQPGLYPLELTAVDANGHATRITQDVLVTAGDYATDYITLPPDKLALLDPELVRQEQERLAAVFGVYRPEKLWSGLLQAPLKDLRLTSPFGSRRSYNGGPANSYHAGTDFGAAQGTPVYAPASGVVVLAEALAVRGNAVILDHGLGVFSGYWHLSGIAVDVGLPVAPGSLLGYVGTTGLSTGSHLHWELRVGEVPVDPMQWTSQIFP